MTTETKNSSLKLKSNTPDGSSKGKIDPLIVKKKIASSSKLPPDSKMKSDTTVTKSEVKSKTTPSSSKTTTTTTKTTTTKTREKKVYNLPGQKHDPPEQKEPLRIFYESLSKQIPTSQMAEFWLMEHGLLSPDRAKKAFEKKQRKQKEQRTGTPVKTPVKPSKQPASRTETSYKPQASRNGDVKAKKRVAESDDDDEFILSPKRRKAS